MSGPLRAGEQVDAWRVEGHLASGGMGHVYRAVDTQTGAAVAIKVLDAGLGHDADVLQRFVREAQLAAQVDRHGGVVRVHSAGQHRGRPYFVMDLVAGRSLDAVLADPLGVEPHMLAGWVRDAARTIDQCHAAGVVHRDLKPGNLLLREDGRVLVADFGLAAGAGGRRLTRTGDVVGTPAYMAPEQIRGGAQAVGPALDIYGLGAILYHGLCGRPPYPQTGALAALNALVHGPPPPPSAVRGGVDPALEAVCLHALQREPGRRPASAGVLAEALEAYLTGASNDAAVAARPLRGALLAALACVVAAAAGGAWLTHSPPTPPSATPTASPAPAQRPVPEPVVEELLALLIVPERDEGAFASDEAQRALLERLAPWRGDPRLAAKVQAGLEARVPQLLSDLRDRLEGREGFLLSQLRRLCAASGAHVPRPLVDRYRVFAEEISGEVDLLGRGDPESFQALLRRRLVLSLLDEGSPPSGLVLEQAKFTLRDIEAQGSPLNCPALFMLALQHDVEIRGPYPHRSVVDFLAPGGAEELRRYPDLASARYLLLAPKLRAVLEDGQAPPDQVLDLLAGLERVLGAPDVDLGPGGRRTVEVHRLELLVRLGRDREARRVAEAIVRDPAPLGSVRQVAAFVLERWLDEVEREALWARLVELSDVQRERGSAFFARTQHAEALEALGREDEALATLREGAALGRRIEEGAVRSVEIALCRLLLARGETAEALETVERWRTKDLGAADYLDMAMQVTLAAGAPERARARLDAVAALDPDDPTVAAWRARLSGSSPDAAGD